MSEMIKLSDGSLMDEGKTLREYAGEYLNGKPIIPDDVEDISWALVLDYQHKYEAFNEYKGGLYFGSANNPYKYLVKTVWRAKNVILHPDTEYICQSALSGYYGKFALTEKVKGIGYRAFWDFGMPGKNPELIIPTSCTKIRMEAFKQKCPFSIVLPDTVAEIGDKAFNGVKDANIIASPKVLMLIGRNVFVAKAMEYFASGSSNNDDAWLEGVIKFKTAFIKKALETKNANALIFAINNSLVKKSEYDTILEIAENVNNLELKAALIGSEIKPSQKDRERAEKIELEKALGERSLTIDDYKKLYNFKKSDDGIVITKYIGNESYVEIPYQIGKTPVVSIEGCAFKNKDIVSVVIPESIKKINGYAFCDCKKLKSVVMGASISEFTFAFWGCDVLESLRVPASVEVISDTAFAHLPSLKSVEIDAENKNYEFDGRAVYSKDGKVLVRCMPSIVGDFDVPQTVREIANHAFVSCEKIQNIHIPETVTMIGNGAFSGCVSLENISLPKKLKKMGEKAFANCKSLRNVELPQSCTSITKGLFSDCSNLTSLCLHKNIKKIEDYAYFGCTSLKHIEITDGVTSIGMDAFAYTKISSVSIPVSVKKLSGFQGCTELVEVNILGTPEILSFAFQDCKNLKKITIPDGVPAIKGQAFKGSGLISIEVPGSVKMIGQAVFLGCKKLEKVVLHEGVEKIAKYAFSECPKLVSFVRPKSLTSIDWSAFDKSGLTLT